MLKKWLTMYIFMVNDMVNNSIFVLQNFFSIVIFFVITKKLSKKTHAHSVNMINNPNQINQVSIYKKKKEFTMK
jgi:hypothetical protein